MANNAGPLNTVEIVCLIMKQPFVLRKEACTRVLNGRQRPFYICRTHCVFIMTSLNQNAFHIIDIGLLAHLHHTVQYIVCQSYATCIYVYIYTYILQLIAITKHSYVSHSSSNMMRHDDIKSWKWFSHCWLFMGGRQRSQMDSPHKGIIMSTIDISQLSAW